MRAKHAQHSLPTFPVYSCAFLSENDVVLGGGGGATKSGIKNKLRWYTIGENRDITLQDEYELERGEDAPMSMAAHPEDRSIVCGVNSVQEKLVNKENENCRVFSVTDKKITPIRTASTLANGDLEDYQKVTVLSPDGKLLAVAGSHSLALLSYPDLEPVSEPIQTPKEIYDASFSSSHLVVATKQNLYVYALPEVSSAPSASTRSRKKSKVDGASSPLKLRETLGLPPNVGKDGSFRAIRYSPQDEERLYALVNTSTRSAKSKTPTRQAFVCKYNTKTWSVERSRKVGDKGVTCFDVSPNGSYLGFGSSDLTIGILDAQTLAPLVNILKAHEFPPTVLKFNPTSSLLVSGSADNSVRVISVPSDGESSSWTWTFLIMVLALLFAILAFAAQQSGSSLGW